MAVIVIAALRNFRFVAVNLPLPIPAFARKLHTAPFTVYSRQKYRVATLQYPKFFGEMCLLVPDGGESLGTVSTNTLVETVR